LDMKTELCQLIDSDSRGRDEKVSSILLNN